MAVEDETGAAAVEGGAPVAETPPVVEPTAPETPVEPTQDDPASAHDEPTLLETLGKEEKPAETTDATPVDEKPVEETATNPVKAAEETAAAEATEPAPDVTFEKFEVPEDFRVDDTRMAEFTGLLGKPRTQETAQAIINFGIDQMRMYAEQLGNAQHQVWTDTRKGWRDAVKADPELGGAGYDTAMARVGRMRDLFVAQSDQQAFNDFLRVTGAGDHPAFLRFLYRVGQKFDEGIQAPAPANPAPDRGRRGGRGRMSALYDHSRSQ